MISQSFYCASALSFCLSVRRIGRPYNVNKQTYIDEVFTERLFGDVKMLRKFEEYTPPPQRDNIYAGALILEFGKLVQTKQISEIKLDVITLQTRSEKDHL